MADRYCTNCGHELRSDGRFCPGCGSAVHEVARVPTPEADVEVPPPPVRQDDGPGRGRVSTARSTRNAFVALGVVVLCILAVIALAAVTGGGSEPVAGTEDGGEGGQAPEQESQIAEDISGGSGVTYTAENFSELVADPEAHQGDNVDITGQIFTAPEVVEGDTAFQMYADPENLEWNTAVLVEGGDDLEVDDYVRVVGTVAGQMEGENMMGGTVTAVMVEAEDVDAVSAVEAVDPTQETVEVGRTLSDQGFAVTLEKIEFGEDTTRAHVALENGTGSGASFYEYDATLIQGARQFDQETTFDYEVEPPQSDLRPGVRTEGVITFGKVDPSRPVEARFEWYSDDYDVTARPIVFEITPSTTGDLDNAEGGSVPEYSAQKDDERIASGQDFAIFTVTTDAESEEDLRAVVEDLQAKNPDPGNLVIFFKPENGDLFGAGFAFEDAEAENALLKASEVGRAEWEAGTEDGTTVLVD